MAGIVGGSALNANPLESIGILMYIWNLHMICMGIYLSLVWTFSILSEV